MTLPQPSQMGPLTASLLRPLIYNERQLWKSLCLVPRCRGREVYLASQGSSAVVEGSSTSDVLLLA
jgi:hypothetical protein